MRIKLFESFDEDEDENLILDLFTEYADKYSLFEIDDFGDAEEDVSMYKGHYLLSYHRSRVKSKKWRMYIDIFNSSIDIGKDLESFAKRLQLNGFIIENTTTSDLWSRRFVWNDRLDKAIPQYILYIKKLLG